MLNFIKKQKSDIVVTLDRPNATYLPGETVHITVDIQPAKELKIQGAQVKLSGTEHYQYRMVHYSSGTSGNRTRHENTKWAEQELFAQEAVLLNDTVLPPDTPQHFTLAIKLPDDALPSYRGQILRVEWEVDAKLDRRLAADTHEKIAIQVRAAAPGVKTQATAYGASNEPDQADMALLLPGLEVVAGQTLAGQLRVQAHKDFNASEVRLELVCTEYVSFDHGNEQITTTSVRLAGNTQFASGQTKTFPFEIAVPESTPTVQTAHGTARWTIKGILARRLRKDTSVEQELEVYT